MSPFLSDVARLTLAATAVTLLFVAVIRLCFRRGKSLEEP